MRITYSCPACDAKGFNTREDFLAHAQTHGEQVFADVNQRLESARRILEEEPG